MNTTEFDWINKTCLVTGAFGFVGTHLCDKLLSKGAQVVALDYLDDAKGTYFGLRGLERPSIVLKADVRRVNQLSILADYHFDLVFHLAAQPISPLSNILPEDTIETNAEGTANVGRALCRQRVPPLFVLASSACWYGATITSPLKEEDGYVAAEFKYSESKVLAEREVVKLERWMPTVRCRFVNLYGFGDRHFSRVIPKTLRHLIRGEEPCLVRNDGSTILDFMFVEDAVSALLVAAEHGTSIRGEVFNFGVGGSNPTRTIDVVKLASRLFDGQEREPVLLNPNEPRTKAKYLDNSKAIQRLGWKPSLGLKEGLRETIRWYIAHIGKIEHLEF